MSEKTIELPQGRVAYRDLGEGPAVLFSHGLFVSSKLWDGVAERLVSAGFRCLLPELPLGSHQIPLNPDTELSPPLVADLLSDFIDALDLTEVTVVGNDSGGAIGQMLAAHHPEKVASLVLTNTDALEVYPPFPFTMLPTVAKVPGGVMGLAQTLRVKPIRWATYRLLTQRAIPDELLREWIRPTIKIPGVRHDVSKVLIGVKSSQLIEATEKLRSFDKPVLMPWGTKDRFFKLELGRRLEAVFPNAKLVPIEGARTFVPLDRPEQVADSIVEFLS